MIIGNREFDLDNRCYVMGILNVTPDSFSDGGKWNSLDRALAHAEEMIKDGADIIDVGGESTRPGYTMISCEEELDRVLPVIEAFKKEFDVPLSIDTYKGPVARGALAAGADVINDIWGFKYDEDVAKATAEYGVPCVLMHNRDEAVYEDFLRDIVSDMKQSVDIAKAAGVADDKIILDPGVGFGKTLDHNLAIINHLDLLKNIGYPVLLGTSRKSVVGQTLDLPSNQRVEGTLATTVIGLMRGCSLVRVHDVKENKRIIKMSEAILAK
ncbi:MAG: dihydropteroate synthase [Firmicutes bacterium]|nr:dihydropteroate synthase [Bacillota bacterium]